MSETQSKPHRRWLILSGIFFLFLCLGGLAYLINSYPIFGNTAVSASPITWTSLPTPTLRYPQFTSYSSAQKINAIAQRDGFLWAATDGGLLVWQESEPSQITKFRSEHGLGENRTTSVAIGMDGSIWVGTASAGVSQYDGATWQTFTTADGLPGNAVRDLAVGVDGTVWVATTSGIGRYDGRRWFSYTRSRTLLQLPSDNVSSLALATDGRTIYAGTAEGVVQFNGRSWDSLVQIGSEARNDVQDVAVTPDGRLWAATLAGLSVFDGSGWQLFTSADGLASEEIQHIFANPDSSVLLSYGAQGFGLSSVAITGGPPLVTPVTPPIEQIFAIYRTARGLWLGSAAGLIYETGNGNWQILSAPDEIPTNEIINLVIANEQPWLGTPAGLSRFSGTSWDMVEGLPETAVSSLNTDSSGRLWATFNTVGQGAASYEAGAGQWQPVSCPVSGPASPYIRQIVQTSDGHLWFATEAGLARFDEDSRLWHLLTEADGLPGDTVQALALHPDGRLWIGTNKGLAVRENSQFTRRNGDDIRELAIGPEGTVWYITAEGVYRVRAGQTENVLPPPVSQVFDVLATKEGLWLAAAEGVAFFDDAQSRNGRWVRFGHRDGLPGDRSTALGVDNHGAVWASSERLPDNPGLSSGLYGSYTISHNYLSQFDGQRWQPILRPAANGLIHPVITSIATTPDGITWLASLGGINRFDGTAWQNYTMLDGLPAHEVYQLLVTKNEIWAVTKSGLAQFNPARQTWKSFAGAGNWTDFESVRMAADASGTLWAGSGSELRRYDGRTWEMVTILPPDPAVEIRDFVVEANGRLLLTAHLERPDSETHFLAEFDGETWRWHEVELPGEEQFAPFTRLWLAPDGRLWASNENTLWRFNLPGGNNTTPSQYPDRIRAITDLTFLPNGKPVAATRFATTPLLLEPDGAVPLELPLAASALFAIQADENGRLWVGSNRGMARQLDDGTWQAFPLSEAELAETITTLTGEPDGSLLLGSTHGTILQWNSGALSVVGNATGGGDGAPISSLFRARDGTLWRASFGNSVAQLEGERWLPFPASPPIYNERILETAVGNPGSLWLTTPGGLVSITTVGERTVCQRLAVDYPGASGLAADLSGQLWLVSQRMVYRGNAAGFERMGTLALPITAVAPDGAVWYVTQTDLVRVQGDQRLPVAHNLDPDTITTLAVGPDGAVWLGTDEGASVLQGGQWRTISAANGLASNQVTHIAIAGDGSMWIGTLGGISWIKP